MRVEWSALKASCGFRGLRDFCLCLRACVARVYCHRSSSCTFLSASIFSFIRVLSKECSASIAALIRFFSEREGGRGFLCVILLLSPQLKIQFAKKGTLKIKQNSKKFDRLEVSRWKGVRSIPSSSTACSRLCSCSCITCSISCPYRWPLRDRTTTSSS